MMQTHFVHSIHSHLSTSFVGLGRQGNQCRYATHTAYCAVSRKVVSVSFVSDQDTSYLLLASTKLWQANLLVCKQGKNVIPFTALNSPRTPTVTELTLFHSLMSHRNYTRWSCHTKETLFAASKVILGNNSQSCESPRQDEWVPFI